MPRKRWSRATVNLDPRLAQFVKDYWKARGFRSFTHYFTVLALGDMANRGFHYEAKPQRGEKDRFSAFLKKIERDAIDQFRSQKTKLT